MKFLLSLSIILSLVIVLTNIDTVDAYNEIITINIDKPIYFPGDTIHVSGHVGAVHFEIPVSVLIIHPNGEVAAIIQVPIHTDKTFSVDISTDNPLMQTSGTHKIKAQYGTNSRIAEALFHFEPVTPVNENPIIIAQNKSLQLEIINLNDRIDILKSEIDNLQNIINEQIKVIMDILVEFKMK